MRKRTAERMVADDKNLRLAEAVMADDLAAARAALADGADLNTRVRIERLYQQGPLVWPGKAALGWAQSVPMAELLLDAGADIDGTDERGHTALRRAVETNRKELIDLYLRRGASATMPLDAARGGGVKLVQQLLEAGAPITLAALHYLRDIPEMCTLLEEWPIRTSVASVETKELMCAARAGDLETVTALVARGASATARDTNGASAIDYARKNGHTNVALVLERAAVAGQPYAGLFLATLDDHYVRIHSAAKEAGVETRNAAGMTALMIAARYRCHTAMAGLFSAGAKVDHEALVMAIEAGNLDGMVMLLDKGARVDDEPAAILRAACRQPDSDLLKQLLQRGLRIAPDADLRSPSTESDRLLSEARAGRLPPAGPTAIAWQQCPLCRDLPDKMGYCNSYNGNQTGEPIPVVTGQFEIFGWSRNAIWKCPHCSTYYDYEFDHDGGIQDGWDAEYLNRLSPAKALVQLRGMTRGPRIDREIAMLEERLEFDDAVAAPGHKYVASGDERKEHRRVLVLFTLSGAGAAQLASRWIPEGQHAAMLADLQARGVGIAETDWSADFVWIDRADGIEVFDRKRKVLDATGDRAMLDGGKLIPRTDIARVIAFADADYEYRGVKAVLHGGTEVPLVTDVSLAAMSGIGYNRNDLICETVWCSLIGRAVAKWAGAAYEDLI